MVHYKSWIILATLVFTLGAFIPSAQADPPALGNAGRPGLPGCLATVAQLEATIIALQAQIADLQASLDAYKNYAPVARTGSTYYERPGDDGDLQMGVEWPVPRLTDNNDGTVTDNLTKLVWLKNADCFGSGDWYQALIWSNNLETGSCGLTDNSSKGEWRLPNRNELLSLVDINYRDHYVYPWSGPLPIAFGEDDAHPFINLQEVHYWTSSTSVVNFGANAWYVFMGSDGSSGPHR